MTRERSIYLISIGLVCGVMAFSAFNFNLANSLGPMKGAFVHLGYPSYFRIELTVAKMLGVLALLIPRIPFKVKELAYFGFGITLISASIAHCSVDDSHIRYRSFVVFGGAGHVLHLLHQVPSATAGIPIRGSGGELQDDRETSAMNLLVLGAILLTPVNVSARSRGRFVSSAPACTEALRWLSSDA